MTMEKHNPDVATNNDERNLMLLGKIYESFEALEETLGKLQLEEPLLMTYAAKKSFAKIIFKNIEQNNQKNEETHKQRLM